MSNFAEHLPTLNDRGVLKGYFSWLFKLSIPSGRLPFKVSGDKVTFAFR